LGAAHPKYTFNVEADWGVYATGVSGVDECANLCREIDECNYFSSNGPACGVAEYIGHDFSEGATTLGSFTITGKDDLELDTKCCEKCSEDTDCTFWVRSTEQSMMAHW
jgi:hypothetical protein